jgi:hypothetical protein
MLHPRCRKAIWLNSNVRSLSPGGKGPARQRQFPSVTNTANKFLALYISNPEVGDRVPEIPPVNIYPTLDTSNPHVHKPFLRPTLALFPSMPIPSN